MTKLIRITAAGLLALLALPFSASAALIDSYVIVGKYVNDTAVDVSNYEIGRVSALNGSSVSLGGTVGVGPTVSGTPTYDGNIAITSNSGEVKMSDINLYAGLGIDCAGSYNSCTDNGGNLSNTKYDDAAGGSGLRNISNGDGVNPNTDLSLLLGQIAGFKDYVNSLDGTDITGSIATDSGDIKTDTVVNLSSGLNILNFTGTSGSDIQVDNASLIFQGAADAYAIVLVNSGALFKATQSNLVIGNGGIGLNNVVIVSQTSGTSANIDLSNVDINGVALWDVGNDEANVSFDNVSGCTQVVGDDVDIQNVRLSRCAFEISVIPVPPAAVLFPSGLAALAWFRRKNKLTRG